MLPGRVAGRLKVLLCSEGAAAGKWEVPVLSDPISRLQEQENTSHCLGSDASSSPPGSLAGKSLWCGCK